MEDNNTAIRTAQERADIIRNTPDGTDPVVYWHQVAMDAIRGAESARKIAAQAKDERNRMKRDYDRLTSRLIDEAARQKSRIPLDVSNLVEMARSGDINLSMSIYVSRGEKEE
jgi:hypothetical protein